MLGLGKYGKSLFYVEYPKYTHVLILWIKGCQFFRNCITDANNNNSFGLGLAAINEVRKHMVHILDNLFVFFYQSDLRIEALTGYKNRTR